MKAGTCRTSTTAKGLEVVETTETSPAKHGKQYRFYSVQVELPQGYYLRLLAVNYFGGDGSGVTSKTPLLTKADSAAAQTAMAAQSRRLTPTRLIPDGALRPRRRADTIQR